MVQIKEATYKELEAIQAIDRMVLGNNSRENYLADAIVSRQCTIAWIGNNTAGFGILDKNFFSQGFIGLLIVHPDYRRQGVATALVQHIESICPTEKLFTSTNESNIIAQKTYESLGFVRSGYIENLDDGDPEIIYFKRPGKKSESFLKAAAR